MSDGEQGCKVSDGEGVVGVRDDIPKNEEANMFICRKRTYNLLHGQLDDIVACIPIGLGIKLYIVPSCMLL